MKSNAPKYARNKRAKRKVEIGRMAVNPEQARIERQPQERLSPGCCRYRAGECPGGRARAKANARPKAPARRTASAGSAAGPSHRALDDSAVWTNAIAVSITGTANRQGGTPVS